MRDDTILTPDQIEAIDEWPAQRPVMWAKPNHKAGPKRIIVAVPALYWQVKRLAIRLATDEELLKHALQLRKKRRVKA